MALAAHSRQIGGQEGKFIKVLCPLYSHLSPVSEGADQLDGDSLVIEELALNLQYAVNWVRAVQDGVIMTNISVQLFNVSMSLSQSFTK